MVEYFTENSMLLWAIIIFVICIIIGFFGDRYLTKKNNQEKIKTINSQTDNTLITSDNINEDVQNSVKQPLQQENNTNLDSNASLDSPSNNTNNI